ncbi:MAG: RtcB family protein [Bacteroidetes bacterium]|nr:RtcB family protein [Bacteroidota bacterium]MBU2584356.1 RtcB family protein [Bacteroidota bacterium]
MTIEKISEVKYRIPKSNYPFMRVDGVIYADDILIEAIKNDKTIEQVANTASLPGIISASLGMPDAHQGYGFCIGGVAAVDFEKGVVSPGGIGYDINCGVRLLTTDLEFNQVKSRTEELIKNLFHEIPSGTGKGGRLKLSYSELDDVLRLGVGWSVKNNYALASDREYIEEHGCIPNADPEKVSNRAKERGRDQLGTLGSGNHFVEVQIVQEIFDEETARAFNLHKDQVVILVHTGSRGLGHQVCTDYLREMDAAMKTYGISMPDRELACVPIDSKEGRNYLGAMSSAANFAFNNRQLITYNVREVFRRLFKTDKVNIVYDVCHNIAKIEEHTVDSSKKKVLVHRKGATRAFPKHHKDIPKAYKEFGQPVLIPGSMGTYSYVLVGTETAMEETFGSTCHGAGRSLSRNKAKLIMSADEAVKKLREKGIVIQASTRSGITEEIPEAYKNISAVVDVVHKAGLSLKVAKLKPIGVIKG